MAKEQLMKNPFEIGMAEVVQLESAMTEFVPDNTEYTLLSSKTNTIFSGSRGSGKSINLRSLEPLSQSKFLANRLGKPERTVEDYLNEDNGAFVGVYINCRDGVLNCEEFRTLSSLDYVDQDQVQFLMNSNIAAEICRKVIKTIREQLTFALESSVEIDNAPRFLSNVCSPEEKEIKLGELLARFDRKCRRILDEIQDKVNEVILLQKIIDEFSNPLLSDIRITPGIFDFLETLRGAIGLPCPFYIMFDEANDLSFHQQVAVNSLIACRRMDLACFKVASQKHGYTFRRRGGRDIDEVHDFTAFDLDQLYTNSRDAYYHRIRKIANQRLSHCGIEVDIEEYLPRNKTDIEQLERAREIASKRYDLMPPDKRPRDKQNYIKKYAPAIVFQTVRPSKGANSYAGFENVVHLSSGIVRGFLECCSLMFNNCLEKNPGVIPDSIPVSIQNESIASFSNSFVETYITQKMENLPEDRNEYRDLMQLNNLLKSLGMLFRKRLMDESSREPRIISVSLKQPPEGDLLEILKLAEQKAFLHKKWYRSKRGNVNLPCYILNRRLCPYFNLDVSGFQGRLEFHPNQLGIALSDPKEFVDFAFPEARNQEIESPQLALFEY